jgi:RNA 3'-terminal phosphate cyclase (ATP)
MVTARLESRGFYPAGGGVIRAHVTPAPLRRLELLERGALQSRRVVSTVVNLARHIADRELQTTAGILGVDDACLRVESERNDGAPGNALSVFLESEHITEVFTGVGEKGLRAEIVAERAATEARAYLDAGVPVGFHLADQLILPMALGEGGVFRTTTPSLHTRTQAELVERMLGAHVTITRVTDQVVEIEVKR